jgi:Raffinose synthase or seed imbibition protein Sip1
MPHAGGNAVPHAGERGHTVVAGPLRVHVTADAVLRIGWDEPDWLGPARLVTPEASGSQRVSASESLVMLETDWIVGEARALPHQPVVVLRLEARTPRRGFGTGEFAAPAVAWHFDPMRRLDGGAPEGLRAFGHQYTEFALPAFSDAAMSRWRLLPIRPAVVLPFGLVAPDGRTLLLAPVLAFHEQIISVPADREHAEAGLLAGWHGDIDDVDAGFATELAVIAGDGARDCFERWAQLLRSASGVAPPARDADVLGTRLSYWTDNGSAYWYRTAPGLDAASTVVAAVEDLEARGLPVGAVQLDSWWYPHEVLRPFNTDEWVVPPSGMVAWEPRADVFPDGVAALRERLDRRPLVTHCRHLSSKSSYLDEFDAWTDGDRAHPKTPELYERLLDQAVAWGVEIFEHDWLIECFLGVRGLRAPGRAAAWQEGMDVALEARDLHAQWCMASPADFAQVSRLRNVTSIRTSGDHGYLVGPEILWAWFLHCNVMARALGLWPYKDVFHSAPTSETREVEALLSALSAGPVGIGDRIGEADIDLIRRTCRADGVLVRPDVPVAATDRAFFDAPVWSGELIVGSAHTQHAAGRWGYVVTCNVGFDKEVRGTRVARADLGADDPDTARVAMLDWRTGSVQVLAADGAYEVELESAGWDYRVLAPVLAGGIAVIGDPAVYACAGDTRVAEVAVDAGAIAVTMLGANERVHVVGWSEHPVSASAWAPMQGSRDLACARDAASGKWDVELDIGPAGWAKLYIR